jgi:hypothetical protein
MPNPKFKVTDEDIEKALDELEEEADEISKGIDDDEEEDDLEKAEDEEDDVEKAEDEDEEDDEDDDEEGDEKVEKAHSKKEDEEDEEDDEEEEEEEMPKKKKHGKRVEKAIEVSDFLKGITDEINDEQNQTRRALGNVAIIMKGVLDEVEELRSVIDSTPRKKKSFINKSDVTDRFKKGIETDEDEEKVLGMRTHKRIILKALDTLAFGEDGKTGDATFMKAITSLEATGSMPADVLHRVEERLKVKIDPKR